MARSSASALPRSAPRTVARRPKEGARRGPQQLSLFGPGHPELEIGAVRRPRQAAPEPVPPVARTGADRPEAVFLRRLNRLADGKVHSVILTDNRRTILSVRPLRGSSIDLRLHRCFLEAPDEILEAVAAFVLARRGSEASREALRHLREHFSRHRGKISRKELRLKLEPVGETCDLRQVADTLNQTYFGGRLKVDITWGKASIGPAHRCHRGGTATIQLGSYSYDDRLVRIHRVLDRPDVPGYVVEAVVYHELLHAAMPPVVQEGRRLYHTPEFRRRERLFAAFERADRWVKQNLPSLLKLRRKAKRQT
jgi:hypothetical protein